MPTLTVSVAELWVSGKPYYQGQEFEAPEREAKILVGIGKAAYKQDEPPAPEPPPRAARRASAESNDAASGDAATSAAADASAGAPPDSTPDTGQEDPAVRRRTRAKAPAFSADSTQPQAGDAGTLQTPESGGELRTATVSAEGEDDRWTGDGSTGSAPTEGRYNRRDLRPKT